MGWNPDLAAHLHTQQTGPAHRRPPPPPLGSSLEATRHPLHACRRFHDTQHTLTRPPAQAAAARAACCVQAVRSGMAGTDSPAACVSHTTPEGYCDSLEAPESERSPNNHIGCTSRTAPGAKCTN